MVSNRCRRGRHLIRSIDYRAGLPDAARTAPLSGMAVGPHRVYLTFAQVP
ncbi:hypothetical protein [Mycobacterium sp.]